MQLARQIFDRGDDARGGTIDGVADDGEMAVADGVETAPAGTFGQDGEIALAAFGMGGGENKEVGLKADDFFETHVGPILRGVNDRDGASEAKGVGDESAFADGDEWIGPNDKENAARGHTVEALLKFSEMVFEIGAERGTGLGNAEDIGQALGGGNDFFHGVGIGAVGRDAEAIERVDGGEEVQTFCDENEIRTESGNLLEAGIDGAADFGFFLGVGGIVTVVGVADEAILEAESVDGFRKARREGDDALDGLGDADGAAGFVNDFLVER